MKKIIQSNPNEGIKDQVNELISYAPELRSFLFEEDDPDPIGGVEQQFKAKPDVYYTPGGVNLGYKKPTQPGLYIINGKKVMIQ